MNFTRITFIFLLICLHIAPCSAETSDARASAKAGKKYIFLSSGLGRARQSDAIDYHRQIQNSYGLRNLDVPLHDDFPIRPLLEASFLLPYKAQFFYGAALSYNYSAIESNYTDQYGRIKLDGAIQMAAANLLGEYNFNMNGPMHGYTALGLGIVYGKAEFGEFLQINQNAQVKGERQLRLNGLGFLGRVAVGFKIYYRNLVFRPEAIYQTAVISSSGTPAGAGLFPLPAEKVPMRLNFSGLYFRFALGLAI